MSLLCTVSPTPVPSVRTSPSPIDSTVMADSRLRQVRRRSRQQATSRNPTSTSSMDPTALAATICQAESVASFPAQIPSGADPLAPASSSVPFPSAAQIPFAYDPLQAPLMDDEVLWAHAHTSANGLDYYHPLPVQANRAPSLLFSAPASSAEPCSVPQASLAAEASFNAPSGGISEPNPGQSAPSDLLLGLDALSTTGFPENSAAQDTAFASQSQFPAFGSMPDVAVPVAALQADYLSVPAVYGYGDGTSGSSDPASLSMRTHASSTQGASRSHRHSNASSVMSLDYSSVSLDVDPYTANLGPGRSASSGEHNRTAGAPGLHAALPGRLAAGKDARKTSDSPATSSRAPTPSPPTSTAGTRPGSTSTSSATLNSSSSSHLPDLSSFGTLNADQRTWSCGYPGCTSKAIFARPCDLRKHFRRHRKHYFCRHDGCPQATEGGFSSQKDRTRHEAKHNPGVECDFEGCDRIFSRVDNMRNHMQRRHFRDK